MNINRRLFWAWLVFAAQMMPFGRLSNRLRELVILRVGWQCRCRYEWGQHVEVALEAGVSDDEIVEVTRDSPQFADQLTTDVIRACDEILQVGLMRDDTWRAVDSALSASQMLELMVLVGHYRMLAAVLVNAGIPLEDGIEVVLRDFNARVASSESSVPNQSAR